jgi:pimeloyl-ACP methyl ester carboxylesterase
MRFLFLHGGPGMNNFAAKVLLQPLFERTSCDTWFWHEPSTLRQDGDRFEPVGAFRHWFASAERALASASAAGPATLVAHSFAFDAATELARRWPARVSRLVLVAPTADLFASFTNDLRLAQRDLAAERPDVAEALGSCIAKTRTFMDGPMREGFGLAIQDVQLLTHFWADPGQFAASMAAQAAPDAQFDLESFVAVSDDYARHWAAMRSQTSLEAPTLALFGGRDPVTPLREQEEAVRAVAPHATIESFDDAGHFLHLDRPARFVETVVKWAAV